MPMTKERISATQSISFLTVHHPRTLACAGHIWRESRDAPMARWPIARNRVPGAACVYLVGRWQLEVSRVRTRWFRGSLVLSSPPVLALAALSRRDRPTLLPRPPFPRASLVSARLSLTGRVPGATLGEPWSRFCRDERQERTKK